jgi:hypothetical protein
VAGRGVVVGAVGLVRWVGGAVMDVVVVCNVGFERECSSLLGFGGCVVVVVVGVGFVCVVVFGVRVRVCGLCIKAAFGIVGCFVCGF